MWQRMARRPLSLLAHKQVMGEGCCEGGISPTARKQAPLPAHLDVRRPFSCSLAGHGLLNSIAACAHGVVKLVIPNFVHEGERVPPQG